MKKLLGTVAVLTFILKIYDVLFNELAAAMASAEPLAYKMGFIVGVALLFVFAYGAYLFTRSAFTCQPAYDE